MAKLEKWSLVGLDEKKPLAVRGEIRDDQRFSDGTPITSSRLAYLDPEGHFACTKNHTYELGAISDAFARWMTEQGRTLASYAAALAAPTATPRPGLTPTPARPADPVTRATPDAPDLRTTVVQEPTLLVAAG